MTLEEDVKPRYVVIDLLREYFALTLALSPRRGNRRF